MASALHKAILDALASPSYGERGILVNALLEATSPSYANERLLYQCVFTIFRALPERLVPGTTLDVATSDLPDGGIEIFWEGKERLPPDAEAGRDLRELMGHGPHGDLVEIAIIALERYCNMHAGHVDTYRERVASASSFERPAHIIRRVLAVLPAPARTATYGSRSTTTSSSHPSGHAAPARDAAG